MTPASVIRAKRDGKELGEEELSFFLRGFLDGEVETYQMSAFLMAVCLRGMTAPETAILTRLMVETGSTLSFPDVDGRKVDKHSTGGVGDLISIPLAPLVAACGVAVPMISGRGLGHTGGTLDKLESIPGFRTALEPEELARILSEVGYAMGGQTEDLAPADRRMYALRDVTGTVESIPLIVSSILSKKVAAGIDALVLDVKCGRGAFMKTEDDALNLAGELTRVASHMGKDVAAFVTDMEAPLGRAVGNGLELASAVDCLQGTGPQDVMELVETLGAAMLCLGDVAEDFEDARLRIRGAVESGAGRERFARLVRAQGGDPAVLDRTETLTDGAVRTEVTAREGGVVTGIDPYALGLAVVDLGGGRTRAEDTIDPRVGLVLEKTLGDPVVPGDRLAWVLAANEEAGSRVARERVEPAYRIASAALAPRPLIRHLVTAEGRWPWEGPGTWDDHAPTRSLGRSR